MTFTFISILELSDVDLTLLHAQPLSGLLHLYYKERDGRLSIKSSGMGGGMNWEIRIDVYTLLILCLK